MKHRINGFIVVAGIVACLLSPGPADAASIPAWLDDAITVWNEENPAVQIEFVDIKDSYVWYMIPATEEVGHKMVRERVYNIVVGHGYKVTDEEEMVITGKPPSMTTPYKTKKCWTRSFVLDIEALSNTTSAGRGGHADSGTRQRMLTSLVCDDNGYWFAGFRILQ